MKFLKQLECWQLYCPLLPQQQRIIPRQGSLNAVRDFRFHTGEVIAELKLHNTTIGEPTGSPVVVLHGSGGSAASILTSTFAGELFGPGQPLDAWKLAFGTTDFCQN